MAGVLRRAAARQLAAASSSHVSSTPVGFGASLPPTQAAAALSSAPAAPRSAPSAATCWAPCPTRAASSLAACRQGPLPGLQTLASTAGEAPDAHQLCGRGDRRTWRGKLFRGTHGKSRLKDKARNRAPQDQLPEQPITIPPPPRKPSPMAPFAAGDPGSMGGM
mmetsp:Transcript_45234/g.114534  ORF Transcript_45234/g.114534 Transcript_45234/m.114534 type:complete len:164 (+) Transcript_45234:138-629(+)